MATPREHLSNAPVREALIDIQFESKIDLELIDAFFAQIGAGYSRRLDLMETALGIGPTGATTTQPPTIVGRRFDNQTSHFVLQVRRAGFTLSRLSPYGDWSELRAEARELWAGLQRRAGDAIRISRIAVRYINELDLPLSNGTFDRYITSGPSVPLELPQGVSAFLQRVTIPNPESRCTAVVTQVMEGERPGSQDGYVVVILDIEVFRTVAGIECEDAAAIWLCLDDLGKVKNQVFFAYLTDRTVEMFE